MDEIWKDVIGYEGLYRVSSFGRVKSLDKKVRSRGGFRIIRGIIRKNSFNGHYSHVVLFKNGVRKLHLVHRLVAMAFIENPYCKPHINHIDGNKRNNLVTNLEWCSPSENMKHAYRTGLARPTYQSSSKSIRCYNKNGWLRDFSSIHEACRVLNLNTGRVWSVLNGKNKHTKGFYFEYKND